MWQAGRALPAVERDLKPRGFALSARVLEFPDGKPGDTGLFLSWGE